MGKLKRTTQEVAEYFKQHGCELLGVYRGALSPMSYKCSCGQYSQISWNSFSNGKRCGHCVKHGQKKKRSLEEIRQIFEERNCIFLDEEFKDIHHKHRYRCKCGTESEISFAAFHHQAQNCKFCAKEKCSGVNHHSWHKDREKYRKDRLFATRCGNMVRRVLRSLNKLKISRSSDILGYDSETLLHHIKSHPSWSSIDGDDWVIDHIFPITAFIEHGVYDVVIINCLDNLQPLSSFANLSKGNRYNKEEFRQWLFIKGIQPNSSI